MIHNDLKKQPASEMLRLYLDYLKNEKYYSKEDRKKLQKFFDDWDY